MALYVCPFDGHLLAEATGTPPSIFVLSHSHDQPAKVDLSVELVGSTSHIFVKCGDHNQTATVITDPVSSRNLRLPLFRLGIPLLGSYRAENSQI